MKKTKTKKRWPPWLRHFRLLLWNRWMEFMETWQEARSQRPLPSLCFSGRSEKPRWPPWPLICWDIFHFSSETAERNSTKRNRNFKQDLNVLYQICVFQTDRKNKMAALASDWLRHFRLLLWTAEQNSTKLDRKEDLNILYQVCIFRADQKNTMAALASYWLRHFWLLLWMEFIETWQEARFQRPLPSLCFSGRSVYKNVRLGRFLKKVAHCTQVHDMWPFGPLVCILFCTNRVTLSYQNCIHSNSTLRMILML